MRESFKMIKKKAQEFINGVRALFMMVNGRKDSKMAKAT